MNMTPQKFLISVSSIAERGSFFCLCAKRGTAWKEVFFQVPVKESDLDAFFERYPTERYDLYFCPHTFTEEKRRKAYAVPSRWCWSDLDEANPERVKPRPTIAWMSSPNRYACLWRVTKTPDLNTTEDMNKNLAYTNAADHSGWDITQVLRIPGTCNHKYDEVPRGKLLWFEGTTYNVKDLLPQTTGTPEEILEKYSVSIFLRRRINSKAVKGSRSEVLYDLEKSLLKAGLSEEEVFQVLKDSEWNKFKFRPDQLKTEIHKQFLAKEDQPSHTESVFHDPVYEEEVKKANGLNLVSMEDVEEEKIDWLWYPYIPMGKLTIIEGDPGLGKSWLTMALTSYVSRGKAFPYQVNSHYGTVLLMSAEDGLGDTIKPRLTILQANPANVKAIIDPVNFDPKGYKAVRDIVMDLKPTLIIIDPLVAYLGAKIDIHKANETREVMARLARLAEDSHAAIVCVRHLTKGGRDKAIYRGLGSIDLTAASRSVLTIGRNPEDPNEGRVLCHIKSNLAPLGKPLAYYLKPKEVIPFYFGKELDISVDDVLKQEPEMGKGTLDDAENFLNTLFETEQEVPLVVVKREAEGRGMNWSQVKKAKKILGITAMQKLGKVVWLKS